MLLADAGVPAGVEVKDSDAQFRYKPFKLAADPKVPATDLAKAFNSRHSDYSAAIVDHVFVIRPVSRKAEYLDKSPAPVRLHARGLLSIAEPLFALLDARLAKPGGRVGSVPGPVGEPVDRGDSIELSINSEGRSVLSALNEIALRAPGHPWLVTTNTDSEPARVTQFGFIHRSGITSLQSVGR